MHEPQALGMKRPLGPHVLEQMGSGTLTIACAVIIAVWAIGKGW